jgi:Mrp family chromosome partitioning ATPase
MVLRIARREVRERWWVILVAVVLAASVVLVASSHFKHKKQWTATTTLILAPSSSGGGKASVTATLEIAESSVSSPAVTQAAAALLHSTVAALPQTVTTAVSASSETLAITVAASHAARAAAYAQALGQAVIAHESATNQATYERDLSAATEQVTELTAKVATLTQELEASLKTIPPKTNPSQFDLPLRQKLTAAAAQLKSAQGRASALSDNGPSGAQYIPLSQTVAASAGTSALLASRAARAVLAALLAVLLALIALVVLAWMDTRIRSREAAEAAFGVPVLAEIPHMRRQDRRSPISAQTRTAVARAYRALGVSLIELEPGSNQPHADKSRVIAVASAGKGDGRSTVAAHLGVSASLWGHRVLVVDADLPRPGVADLLGVQNSASRPDEVGVSSFHLREQLQASRVAGLRVLPFAGSAENPVSVVPRLRDIANDLRSEADQVIIDTPPLLEVPESILLAELADSILVVCRWGRTSRGTAWLVAEQLARVDTPVAGVVLVDAPASRRVLSGRNRLHTARSYSPDRSRPTDSGRPASDVKQAPVEDFAAIAVGTGTENGSAARSRSTVPRGDDGAAG